MLQANPQNPYSSYVVEASAGSGKTYQLSRRYLNLIAAGVDPDSILTVTFTLKAAAEMRGRIIADAYKLVTDKSLQIEFDEQLSRFYQDYKSQAQGLSVRNPLSAYQAGRKVLSSTQQLRVSTIDSLFHQWVQKFSVEAEFSPHNLVTQRYSIGDAAITEKIEQDAWLEVFETEQPWHELMKIDHEASPLTVRAKLEELSRHDTHLWSLGQSPLIEHRYPKHGCAQQSELVASLEEALQDIVAETKNRDNFLAAIAQRDLEALCRLGLITKKWTISGSLIRGKKRDLLAEAILKVEESLQSFINSKRLQRLNEFGLVLTGLYDQYAYNKDRLKKNKNIIEFNDLNKASFHLFHSDMGVGALWLLCQTTHHFLIDEFQDTSFLQWQVLRKLANELLSGMGTNDNQGVMPSLFIVGDKKQSIYGFREADPRVLDLAKKDVAHFGKETLSLNKSYRSSAMVLNFVNAVFTQHFDPEFPIHESALDHNNGQIFVFEPHKENTEEGLSGLEQEAIACASFLQQSLSKSGQFVVKKEGYSRPMEPGDCCILFRQTTHMQTFEKHLKAHGIPYMKEESSGFFAEQCVQDALEIMRHLQNPEEECHLIGALKGSFFGVEDSEILRLLQQLKERGVSLLEVCEESASQVYEEFFEFRCQFENQAPHQVVYGLLQFCHPNDQLAIEKLLEAVLEIEGLYGTDLNVVMPILDEQAELDLLAPASIDANCVKIMTIHKSKGLEFPFVWVVESAQDWHKLDKYWHKSPDGVYYVGTQKDQPIADAAFDNVIAKQTNELKSETIRLLYVALTRSSQYLVVSGHEGKRTAKSNFLQKMLATAESLGAVFDERRNCWQIGKPTLAVDNERAAQNSSQIYEMSELPAAVVTPAEVRLIYPHQSVEHRESLLQNRAVYPELQARLGSFVHKALEFAANNDELNLHEAWEHEVIQTPEALACKWTKLSQQQLFEQTQAEIENTLNSPKWLKLFDGALKVHTEVPIVHYRMSTLTRGVIDLLIEKPEEVLVLDYKTVALQGNEDLRMVCSQQGYSKQMSHYISAVQQMHPSKRVNAMIWFTKLEELVMVCADPGG